MKSEYFNPKGELEAWAIFKDGTEKCFFSDHNVITSGMGVGWGLLFAGSGSQNITNFQIRFFQVGTSGNTVLESYDYTQVELVSPLASADYGSSKLSLSTHRRLIPSTQDITLQSFVHIPGNAVKRVGRNSVTYFLTLDELAANDQIINEIGLFMDNPTGASGIKQSILVAYRPFVNIIKTDEFSLVFKWTITI